MAKLQGQRWDHRKPGTGNEEWEGKERLKGGIGGEGDEGHGLGEFSKGVRGFGGITFRVQGFFGGNPG